MTSKDKEIWQSYARRVKPVRKKLAKPPNPMGEIETPDIKYVRRSRPVFLLRTPLPDPPRKGEGRISSSGLERNREKSLRQGDIAIEAKLDLHGMTQTEAFEALAVFMHRCVKNGKRHLLIITGKGREGAGVLRGNFKNWLGDLPEAPAILAIRPAAAKHGGGGAFYVLLRKS